MSIASKKQNSPELATRAQRAIAQFRRMEPGLTTYARAVTKQPRIAVRGGATGSYTDGRTIFVSVPMSLGDDIKHVRELCNKRDGVTGKQLCESCNAREEILVSVYHEIAHLAYGSFERVTDGARKAAVLKSDKLYGSEYAKKRIASMSGSPDEQSYVVLAGTISSFLPLLVNSIEDIRIDERMFNARKGIRRMREAFMREVFDRGIERPDGTRAFWRDAPLNAQMTIALYVVGCDFEVQGNFHDDVLKVLEDERVIELCIQARSARDASEAFDISFELLMLCREYGFFREDNEEDDPANQAPEEGSDEEEGADNQDGNNENLSDKSEENGSDDSGEADPEASGSKDDSGGDEVPSSGDTSQGGDDVDEEEEGDKNQSKNQTDSSGGESEEAGAGGGVDPQDGDASDRGDSDPEHGDSSSSEGESELAGSDDGSLPPSPSDRDSSEGLEEDEPDGWESEPESSDSDVDPGTSEPEVGGTYGGAGDIAEFIEAATGHHGDHETAGVSDSTSPEEGQALKKALLQGEYFEKPPINVVGVNIKRYDQYSSDRDAWWGTNGSGTHKYYGSKLEQLGIGIELDVPEMILGPALLETRRTFNDNLRSQHERNLKSGKINNRALGKRAWAGDPRLFKKTTMPGKKSYSVLIGIDISGSTLGKNIVLAKRAAKAQAELCHRVGIDFAIYAHTAEHDSSQGGLTLEAYEIKSFQDPWDTNSKEAFANIGSFSENIDGHTIQFYRKMIERQNTTEKIILYYSDGKMPAANAAEELVVLRDEIRYCDRHGIRLMGVGIRTDSPRKHGLDTVRVDTDQDLIKVIRHLEAKLIGR